jgi:hypothetical protein
MRALSKDRPEVDRMHLAHVILTQFYALYDRYKEQNRSPTEQELAIWCADFAIPWYQCARDNKRSPVSEAILTAPSQGDNPPLVEDDVVVR